MEELNENIKSEALYKQNKTFENYNSIKNSTKEINKKGEGLNCKDNINKEFRQINLNFYDENNQNESKKHNLTDIHISKSNKNHNKNAVINYELEKEKLDFFEFFNYENLYNMHKYYSKLISLFELKNNFFQREKILKKLFEILNTKPYYFPHRMIRFFEDKALIKHFKLYFFIEITIFSLLFHSNINEYSDLYFAFKHCLFYLNQNLLILTHFIIEKIENIEKYLKKDLNFENYYLSHLNAKIQIDNYRSSAAYNISKNKEDFLKKENFTEILEDSGNLKKFFLNNILEKEFVVKCIEKLEENKTWLDKHYIFKNFNNNNKNLVNVCKNIIDIFINMPVEKNELLIAYYEIKDILMDLSKIKLEKNIENFEEKVNKIFLLIQNI